MITNRIFPVALAIAGALLIGSIVKADNNRELHVGDQVTVKVHQLPPSTVSFRATILEMVENVSAAYCWKTVSDSNIEGDIFNPTAGHVDKLTITDPIDYHQTVIHERLAPNGTDLELTCPGSVEVNNVWREHTRFKFVYTAN